MPLHIGWGSVWPNFTRLICFSAGAIGPNIPTWRPACRLPAENGVTTSKRGSGCIVVGGRCPGVYASHMQRREYGRESGAWGASLSRWIRVSRRGWAGRFPSQQNHPPPLLQHFCFQPSTTTPLSLPKTIDTQVSENERKSIQKGRRPEDERDLHRVVRQRANTRKQGAENE